ncbi:hypothetical protein L0657_24925 [Dyadobacter sp. CY345]|uniref:hypothetical protein n=1 Tax=Dyadobacter sp. CY345 TaxID=2909335 RepID=UPI001F230826|nr:hypothetical protein [Dyadobacter sp. CY345]MCF2447222.1 hypothetical protein [Dyadobacter sp. CY345]
MKSIFVILALTFFLCDCRDKDPEPLPAIKEIFGTWRLEAYGRTINGEIKWESVSSTDQPYLITFRHDGVVLNDKGLPVCCAPKSYTLNGVLFEIIPKEKVESNPQCAFVDCITSKWNIEQNEDQLILTLSDVVAVSKSKYVRQ